MESGEETGCLEHPCAQPQFPIPALHSQFWLLWLFGALQSHTPVKMKVFISPTSFCCAGLLLPLGSEFALEPQR